MFDETTQEERSMDQQQNIDFVLRTVEKRGIRFVRLWFTDVVGRLKSFAISPEDLEVAFEEGIGFDGSSVEGFTTPDESDMLAFPDPSTFQVLPWRPSHDGVARVFCDIYTPDHNFFPGDSRACLRHMFMKAERLGYFLNVGTELEFYYFPNDGTTTPLDSDGYFDLTPADSARELRRSTVLMLEKMSIPVEYTFHSAGRSQHGISLRHAEALSASDAIMTAKHVIQLEAFNEGINASFMPKPRQNEPSSAMFLHQSLFDREGNNLFWDEDDRACHLSTTAKSYMAGILDHAAEISAITNPTVNSYKRLSGKGGDGPRYATWGMHNRAAMIRVPAYKPGKEVSTRIELRNPDAMANPYLACAVTLAAGLDGIERGLELPPERTPELLSLSERELVAQGIKPLPRTLDEALDAFEASELMKEVLGEHIHTFYLEKKREECERFNSTVTEWELERYLRH